MVVVEQEIGIAASTATGCEEITKHIGRWFWSGEKGGMSPVAIEERAGGRFYRESPDGSCDLYGIVTAIRPGKLIRIEGSIGGKYATMSIFEFKIEVDGGDEGDKGKDESGTDDEKTERMEIRGIVASFTLIGSLNELVL